MPEKGEFAEALGNLVAEGCSMQGCGLPFIVIALILGGVYLAVRLIHWAWATPMSWPF